jgi:uncharacterized protein (TIGR03435 family)
LVTGGITSVSGGTSAAVAGHTLSLERCGKPEAPDERTVLPALGVRSGEADVLSDLVRSAYGLRPEALAWPEGQADPTINLLAPDAAFRAAASSDAASGGAVGSAAATSLSVPLTDECSAFVRRALTEELGLEGHFEARTLPAFELTRTARDLRGLEPPSPAAPWIWRELPNRIEGTNAEMRDLAEHHGGLLGVRVLDRTGVPGNYDFTFSWEPASAAAADRRERDEAAMLASLRAAGFDLVGTQLETDVLVVDRIVLPQPPSLLNAVR